MTVPLQSYRRFPLFASRSSGHWPRSCIFLGVMPKKKTRNNSLFSSLFGKRYKRSECLKTRVTGGVRLPTHAASNHQTNPVGRHLEPKHEMRVDIERWETEGGRTPPMG